MTMHIESKSDPSSDIWNLQNVNAGQAFVIVSSHEDEPFKPGEHIVCLYHEDAECNVIWRIKDGQLYKMPQYTQVRRIPLTVEITL